MKDFSQKKAMEDSKLKKEEIIPAEDILTDEMAEEVEGGKIRICISGKIVNDELPQENGRD